uniref:Uncharacterized protein n=2 Tax=Rhodosorus marinus TaxID=101924 RepID=A0A7S2Z8T4_9RHOD|mmetsp:Transcript_10259/g.42961  ORF Transcript_10259/g.42961 Transcript_10259/m.42961 type:complete len:160 (+) Transcript_10259:602-1081(+)|eukprot:CAMPEP_0113970460 /NCGR_PEP_ID=MMETSP0011_2-20120614/11210_1 /TAXON_ID=101924 /ORGANISM="Rhodosorus marinus" /LENGTH=159 /DNA_ID=CAMNT_0000984881 /DNA_START=556 /DNA_END=1035 /DNA_ORIENTATION=- /assembly_acc=CAM_ASM_000156
MDSRACFVESFLVTRSLVPRRAQSSRRYRRVITRKAEEEELKFQLPEGYELAMKPEGDPECEQCVGKGSVECNLCNGEGMYTVEMMGKVSSCQCRLCDGRKKIPCPSCKRLIYTSVVWWNDWKQKDDAEIENQVEGREKADDEDDDLPHIYKDPPPYVK